MAKKKAEETKEVKIENVTNEQLYEALVCIAVKLDAMLAVFEKLDKEIDKKNGV